MKQSYKRRNFSNSQEHLELQERQRSEQHWSDFLNATLGVLGFPLGLTCLTTKTPSINAALSVVFLLAIWFNNRRLMPKHFREPSKSKHIWRTWRNNSKFWLGTAPALLGYFYLCFVAASQPIALTCTRSHQCQWFVDGVSHYVGSP
ncbi:hypothetical protein HDE76_000031 [Rhodanobacter sp. ANJX3]|nr:hypothetical protein [Rhodanobacter sp. ANJX3]